MKSKNLSLKKLFKWFLIEEYKMYKTMFGSKRLYLFPLVLAIFGLAFGVSTPVFNVSVELLGVGFLFIVLLFGVQTGSIGFEAKDSISNLLGESSRILFSSRYLPINRRKLVYMFIVKDVLFYCVFMLLPVVIGIFVGVILSPFGTVNISAILILEFYSTTVSLFIFGMSFGFLITILSLDKFSQIIISVIIAITIISSYIFSDLNLTVIMNMNVIIVQLILFVGSAMFVIIGSLKFKKNNSKINHKKYSKLYANIKSFYPKYNPNYYLISKFLVDIIRSPGGLWKVLFSTGMITISGASVVLIVTETIVTQNLEIYPIIFSVIISLTAYPVYTMIFRYDEFSTYDNYPVSKEQVMKSKFITYIILSTSTSLIYYIILVSIYQSKILHTVIGLFIIVGFLIYQFGIMSKIVKDKPLQFLFDGFLFSVYSSLMMFIMIPLLIVGMYGLYLSSSIVYGVGFIGILLGFVGSIVTYHTVKSYK